MNQPVHPAHAYLRLAEGPEDLLAEQISLTRRLLTLIVAVVLLSGTSLFATAAFDLDKVVLAKAFAASGPGHSGSDDDNSGPGGGDDDDDDDDTGTDNTTTQSGSSNSDDNDDGTTDSSHGKQASDSSSDDNRNGGTDSSKQKDSDDSNSDDNHNGNSDSSHGASVSMRSHATSDGKGDHTRG
jgi:hypothetical protein